MKTQIQIHVERLQDACWGKSKEVAEMLGVTRTSLSRKIHGTQRIFLDEINAIARFFRKDADFFLKYVPDPDIQPQDDVDDGVLMQDRSSQLK